MKARVGAGGLGRRDRGITGKQPVGLSGPEAEARLAARQESSITDPSRSGLGEKYLH